MKMIILSIVASLLLSCSSPQQEAAKVKQLTPKEFKAQQMNSKSVLLDVRTPEEFAGGHLEGALNSDYRGGEFTEQLKNLDKDKAYYLYCASGNRSSKAAEAMREAGFKHIYNIGGYNMLKEAGVPTNTSNQK
jgi:phage shock protein E